MVSTAGGDYLCGIVSFLLPARQRGGIAVRLRGPRWSSFRYRATRSPGDNERRR